MLPACVCMYVCILINPISTSHRVHWPCSFIQLQSKLCHGNIGEFFSPSCAKESIGEPSDTYRWWSHPRQAVVKCGFSSLCCCPIGKERYATVLALKCCERWRTNNINHDSLNSLSTLNAILLGHLFGCTINIPLHLKKPNCRCVVEAWGLLQRHTTKLNIEELLKHMYEICQEMGLTEDLLKLPFTDTEQVSVDEKKNLNRPFEKRRGRIIIDFWRVLFLIGVFGEVFTDQCGCSESWISFSPPPAACQQYPSTTVESVNEG